MCCIFAIRKGLEMFRQRFNLFLTSASLVIALMSCTGHYKIDGVVETIGYEGRELSLVEFLPFRITKIDSCVVNHGRFQMKGNADSTRLVFLCKEGRPIIPLYIEKGHARVSLLPTEMTVSGTRQNDLFYNFLRKKIEFDNLYEDMSQKRVSMARSRVDFRSLELIQDSLRMIVEECEDMICSFMADNYDEPAAVGVFMMLSANPTTEVPSLLRRILDAAPDDFLNEPYVNGYANRISYERN